MAGKALGHDKLPDFVDQWHGHGAGHQAGNEPGDTAQDRHGFEDNPTPGGVEPTYNAETGLPTVPVKEDTELPEEVPEHALDMLF